MIALDSSVAIAAFATWHESHAVAAEALTARPRLVAHSALETFSVLTRLPPPHRAPAPVVQQFLAENFAEPFLALSADGYRDLVDALTEQGLSGGAAYDALVATSARQAGAALLSLDRRASLIYRAVGVDFEILGGASQ